MCSNANKADTQKQLNEIATKETTTLTQTIVWLFTPGFIRLTVYRGADVTTCCVRRLTAATNVVAVWTRVGNHRAVSVARTNACRVAD